MSGSVKQLTSGRLLARNTGWSLLGTVLPFLVAAVAIPVLIRGLGTERFGLLSIIWVVIGYFSIFDLGLGRALTQMVAEKLGAGREREIPHLAKTALVMTGLIGLGAAALVGLITPWLAGEVLRVPATLRVESVRAFWILAGSLPFIIVSGSLIGLLQAHQKFRAISSIRIVIGSLNFLGPLIVLHWSRSLTAAAAALAATRVLAAVAYTIQYRYAFPSMWHLGHFRTDLLRHLMRFGSWFAADNIIAPLMVYVDRFVIGAVLGLTAVAYYATPYEVVTRLIILPVAFVSVLFPAFTTALAGDEARVAALFGRACRVVVLAMLPVVALIVLFAPEGLALWVGPAFAEHSSVVLRWLAVGVLVHSLAHLPSALVQGAGRPDLVFKLHLAELPLYLVGLWLLLRAYGIEGVALAWTLRVAFNALGLFWLSVRRVPAVRAVAVRAVGAVTAACGGVGLLVLVPGLDLKIGSSVVLLTGTVLLGYREARNMRWRLWPSQTEG